MSYLYYVLPATLTFLIALYAFFRDTNASKTSVLNWSFVFMSGLLWPLTLPFIVWKKLSSLFGLKDIEARFSPISYL
ncbi:MAG: hypothetical protein AAGI69_08280 [Cyanobacteria bacterium P01_H01_bin.21]